MQKARLQFVALKPLALKPLTLISLALLLPVSGCSDSSKNDTQVVSIQQVSVKQQLQQIYQDYAQLSLSGNAITAAIHGDFSKIDKVEASLSANAIAQRQAIEQQFLNRINAISPSSLTQSALVNYQVFKRDRELAVRGLDWLNQQASALANSYLPYSRTDSIGIGQLPNGKAWYQYLIEQNTSTTLAADKIHRLGLAEVNRLHQTMQKLQTDIGFIGTLADFFRYMADDSQFFYSNDSDKATAYQARVDNVLTQTRQLMPIPKDNLADIPSPPNVIKTAAANNHTWATTAWVLHHQVPGKQLQYWLQQQLALPQFRTSSYQPVYTEGWGLYAESLSQELGLDSDPYQNFGLIASELWYSALLVVDTGIHQKAWSRQQGVQYLLANSPVTKAAANAAVNDIVAQPGHALAAKIGQLKLAELRRLADNKLGNYFTAKAFHHQILSLGAVPLLTLEQAIRRWIVTLRR